MKTYHISRSTVGHYLLFYISRRRRGIPLSSSRAGTSAIENNRDHLFANVCGNLWGCRAYDHATLRVADESEFLFRAFFGLCCNALYDVIDSDIRSPHTSWV